MSSIVSYTTYYDLSECKAVIFLLCMLMIYFLLVAGDLPVVISCASLALADAGIMMYDVVASVSVVCM